MGRIRVALGSLLKISRGFTCDRCPGGSLEALGCSLGRLGCFWVVPGVSLGALGCSLGGPWELRESPWELLGSSWGALGSSLEALGCSLGALGCPLGALGCSLGALGGSLGALGSSWGPLGVRSGASWVRLGPLGVVSGASWVLWGSSCARARGLLKPLGKLLGSPWGLGRKRRRKNQKVRKKQEKGIVGFLPLWAN